MKKRGRGVATVFYPTGFNGGGDPDMVTLHIKADGTIEMSNATCEMGQGFKMVAIQMAAEALGVDESIFTLDNSNTDTSAFSMDTAGSRSTYIVGLAAIDAAQDLIKKVKTFAAGMLDCQDPAALQYDEGKVWRKDDPEKCVTLAEIGGATTYGGVCLMGCGGFLPPPAPPQGSGDRRHGAQPLHGLRLHHCGRGGGRGNRRCRGIGSLQLLRHRHRHQPAVRRGAGGRRQCAGHRHGPL